MIEIKNNEVSKEKIDFLDEVIKEILFLEFLLSNKCNYLTYPDFCSKNDKQLELSHWYK